IAAGEIRGLLTVSFNPLVSLPDSAFVRAQLERLEFYAAIDFFLNDTARYAHVVLPGSQQEEDEGTVTTTEGRIVKINRAVASPGDARRAGRTIQHPPRALGRPQGFEFPGPEEIFDGLRRAPAGGIADYAGVPWERVERERGVFWPCPAEDHPGTP